MTKKGVVYALTLLILFTPVYSTSIGISPNETTIETQIGTGRILPFVITNHLNVSIIDITINDIIPETTFTPITRLEPNQSAQFNLTINKTQLSTSTFLRKFLFSEARLINISNTNRQVNISNTGFQPASITITPGDTITWNNTDTISHTVTSQSFDQTITPNSTFSFTFNDRNIGLVFDRINTFTQPIQYQNQTQVNFFRNPDNDVPVSITISSSLENTRLNLLLLDPSTHNTTVEVGNRTEGVIRIINPTSVTAVNVSINGSFVTFSKSLFNVEPGTPMFTNFVITPPLNQSNLTYHIIFVANGQNVLAGSEFLDVFVPFKEIDQSALRLNKSSEILSQIKELCAILPDSPICRQEPIIQEHNVTQFVEKPLPFNFTQERVDLLLRSFEQQKDDIRIAQNFVKDTNDQTRASIEHLEGNMSTITESMAEAQRTSSSANTKFWILLIFVVGIITLAIGLTGGYYIYQRIKESRGVLT